VAHVEANLPLKADHGAPTFTHMGQNKRLPLAIMREFQLSAPAAILLHDVAFALILPSFSPLPFQFSYLLSIILPLTGIP